MAQHLTFTTEIPDMRPQTTSKLPSARQPQQSLYLALRRTKAQVKQAMKQYQDEMINHHKVKRSLDITNHKSLLKRNEFLKIYNNKKAMFHSKQLLETRRQERERFQRKSVEMVKRKKLQSQLQQILRQNQHEDHIYQLHQSHKKDKEVPSLLQKIFQRQLTLSIVRQNQGRHHDQIKKRNQQFLIRKKNMHTSLTQRSKNNYQQKIQKQLNLIQQYESIMGEVEDFFEIEIKPQTSTMCHTLDPGRTLFLTSKNTLQ